MVVCMLEQRLEILRHYVENHDNVVCENCVRILEEEKHPSAPYVRYLVKKVQETGILINKPNNEKPNTREYCYCGKKCA